MHASGCAVVVPTAMNKKALSERDICSKFITPALKLPLPPLAEQHRIVAKVDELMALCDCLQTQLTTSQTTTRRLLESLLHQAFSPRRQRI
jgi:restriction endonuclease S subunit